MPLEIREIVIKARLESDRPGDVAAQPSELTPEMVDSIRAIIEEEYLELRRKMKSAEPSAKFDR